MSVVPSPTLARPVAPSAHGASALHPQTLMAAMLQHEAAMARTFSHFGVIRTEEALSIASTCRLELFDAEQLLRDTLHQSQAALHELPPLIERLRDTVELFNPQAARQVFRAGRVAALQKNALLLLTRQFLLDLDAQVQALLRALNQSFAPHAERLARAWERVQQLHNAVLQLRLPTRDEWALAHQGEFLAHLAQALDMPPPGRRASAQPDDWVALGLQYSLLQMCLAEVAALAAPGASLSDRAMLEAQARRAPVVAAQWMGELPVLQADDMGASREFWEVIWPQWVNLSDQTAWAVRAVHAAVAV